MGGTWDYHSLPWLPRVLVEQFRADQTDVTSNTKTWRRGQLALADNRIYLLLRHSTLGNFLQTSWFKMIGSAFFDRLCVIWSFHVGIRKTLLVSPASRVFFSLVFVCCFGWLRFSCLLVFCLLLFVFVLFVFLLRFCFVCWFLFLFGLLFAV